MQKSGFVLIGLLGFSSGACLADAPKIVTAAQVNGVWQKTDGGNVAEGAFKILALGGQRLRVEFSGFYRTQGGGANVGEGRGIARIEGATATFRPDDAEEECAIVLEFGTVGMTATQEGICGFGFNVSAEGKYRRVKAGKPKFDG